MNMVWWDEEEDARKACEDNREVWTRVGQKYAVSNYGRAASESRGSWKSLRKTLMASGYETFNLGEHAGLAHRIVVRAFDGEPPTDQHTDVRHLDGVKTNNELINLRYGTRSENMLDVSKHREAGRLMLRDRQIEEASSEGTWFGGRTWDKPLVELLFQMESDKRLTLTDVAKILDVSRDVVQNIALGRSKSRSLPPTGREKQARRTPPQKLVIQQKLKAGWSLSEINQLPVDLIGKPLTHQDVYFYKTKIGLG